MSSTSPTARTGKKWSKEEIEEAINLYCDGLTVREIAKRLQRKEGAIRHQLRRQKIDLHNCWSQDEINFLIQNWNTLTTKEISEKLKRPYVGVRWQAAKHKLTGRPTGRPPEKWMKEEDNLLRMLMEHGVPMLEIATRLGKSYNKVRRRRTFLKIKINRHIVRNARIVELHKKGMSSREIAKIVGLGGSRVREILCTHRAPGSPYARDG